MANLKTNLPHFAAAHGNFAGACTVGSTEACLLAGLALKFRWRAWYAKKIGKAAQFIMDDINFFAVGCQRIKRTGIPPCKTCSA